MNRRTFLATSAVASTAPLLRAAGKRRLGLTIWSYHIRWKQRSPEVAKPGWHDALDVLDHCRDLGAGCLQIGVRNWTEDFAGRVREKREARLVLLGEGRLREELEELARHLGIHEDVGMPGFVDNPFRYMARSAALALSSEYEGLPGVLIQAMACGCPVVSTNCPGGSEEVLDSGRFGQLVNVGDADALASALASTLSTPLDRDVLIRRAEEFSVEQAVDNYLALIDSLYEQSAGPA